MSGFDPRMPVLAAADGAPRRSAPSDGWSRSPKTLFEELLRLLESPEARPDYEADDEASRELGPPPDIGPNATVIGVTNWWYFKVSPELSLSEATQVEADHVWLHEMALPNLQRVYRCAIVLVSALLVAQQAHADDLDLTLDRALELPFDDTTNVLESNELGCSNYIARGGPLAGVIIAPTVSLAGVGMALYGSTREESSGELTGAGRGLIAGGVVAAVVGLVGSIVAGQALGARNRERRKQTLSGCPPY